MVMHEEPKYIAHFDLDSFFVSVEVLLNPALKGKAVIVGGSAERGVVSTCSYEARKFGVRSAMPMRRAMQLCPHAIIAKSGYSHYSHYSRLVTDLIASEVPSFEKASIDEFYCDLSGMNRFFGVSKFAQQLRKTIIEKTGLPISCGLASAKFISKMATNEAKPNGFLEIPPGKEKEFLWPQGIEKINGVGAQTEQLLKSYGLHTIADLANIPLPNLRQIIGKQAESLQAKAHGIGSTTLRTDWIQKSYSRETTFGTNTTDIEFLQKTLVSLIEKNAFDLRQDGKLTGCVGIKLRYENFDTVNKQMTIDYTCLDNQIIYSAKNLLEQLYRAHRPVRLIGVKFSQIITNTFQLSLFEEEAEHLHLYKAADALKVKYGSEILKKATSLKKKEKD